MKLIIEDDEGRKTVVPFVRDEITIGRQEGNTIRLTERNVSRKHARLLKQNGHIFVEDLGSYNGIKINGDRVRGQVTLNEGDLVQIGDYDLAVQRESESATHPVPTRPNAALPDLEATAPNLTPRLADTAATVPALPAVADTPKGLPITADEPDEADPDDVQSAPTGETEHLSMAATQPLQAVSIDHETTDRSQALDVDAHKAPRLIVMNTELAGREFACIRRQLTVGRTDDNDIAIDHRSLSRNHCKIVRDEQGDWRVIDLASANGLLVNGETYQQSVLKNGDILELGHVKLKFLRAGERLSLPTETDEVEGGGRAMMFVGLAALVVAVAGIGYWVLNQSHPIDPGLPPPGGGVAKPPPSAAETKLASARDAIERLDWVGARNTLKTCMVGESPCPEATTLLSEMDVEEALKSALDSAEQLLNDGKLDDAKVVLTSASHTKLLEKRYATLTHKLEAALQHKLANPTAAKPPVDPAAERAGEVARLHANGRQALKDKDLAKARSLLESCIKVDANAADCHMALGATYAKLDKADLGLKHYKRFLELDPNHPSAAKVRQFVDDYTKTQGTK